MKTITGYHSLLIEKGATMSREAGRVGPPVASPPDARGGNQLEQPYDGTGSSRHPLVRAQTTRAHEVWQNMGETVLYVGWN